MSEQVADNIIQYRIEAPFTDINNFRSFDNLATIIPQTNELSVNTNYFMLETNVVIGGSRVTMYSIINRSVGSSDKISILARSQGVF